MKKYLVASFALAFVIASTAEARRDQAREGMQQSRIKHGMQSGQLTRKEARELHRGQVRVDRAQRRAQADGTVNQREQHRLEARQDLQSKRIHEAKHNDETRPDAQRSNGRESSGQFPNGE